MATPTRTKSRRLEVRTTDEERELIDHAVERAGTDLSFFVVQYLMDAARKVLADRDHFVLSPEVAAL